MQLYHAVRLYYRAPKMRNGSETVILWRRMRSAILPNYQAMLICM